MYRLIQILVLAHCLSTNAVSAELSADEQSVWNLEVSYWEYVKSNDITNYRALWHERFVGWPGFSRSPVDKNVIHQWIAPYHEDPSRKFDYELQMESVRSHGADIVVAHYLVHGKFLSADNADELPGAYSTRITHTWQRNSDGWLIITGMSGSWIGDE